jgi:methyltransferase (TIGR00027 family)
MALPDLSSSMYVAQLRFIQSRHESAERRNPDSLVRYFIPMIQRLRGAWVSRKKLSRLRADPFYYYLVARTVYYDQVVKETVSDGVRRIVSIGAGSDTRAYRFVRLLHDRGVKVVECDQPEAIFEKRRIASRLGLFGHVEYLPIDLNADSWPEFAGLLGNRSGPKTLVLMEGVSPYINDSSFRQFLFLLSSNLSRDSYVAYDYKLRGIKDDFGLTERTQRPFRLSSKRDEVAAFHEEHGLVLDNMELSSEMCARLLPGVASSGAALFGEDGLVRLAVGGSLA